MCIYMIYIYIHVYIHTCICVYGCALVAPLPVMLRFGAHTYDLQIFIRDSRMNMLLVLMKDCAIR